MLCSAALVEIPVGRRRRLAQSETPHKTPIHLKCMTPQQQLFTRPLSWAQFEAGTTLNNSSTHMSIFYVYTENRRRLRFSRVICELVAASAEICLDHRHQGKCKSKATFLHYLHDLIVYLKSWESTAAMTNDWTFVVGSWC